MEIKYLLKLTLPVEQLFSYIVLSYWKPSSVHQVSLFLNIW